jgi:pyruvate/2-oxoglutarate dehydrogenase complex dihydrolipoamide acyltransferase (E2) component
VALQSGDRLQIGHNLLEFFDESAPAPIRVASDAPATPSAPAAAAAAGPEPAAEPEAEPAPDPGQPVRKMSGSDRDLLVVVLVVAAILAGLGGYLLVRSLRASPGTAPTATAESEPPRQP